MRLLGGRIARLTLRDPLPLHVGDRVLLRDPGRQAARARRIGAAGRQVGYRPGRPGAGPRDRRAVLDVTRPLPGAAPPPRPPPSWRLAGPSRRRRPAAPARAAAGRRAAGDGDRRSARAGHRRLAGRSRPLGRRCAPQLGRGGAEPRRPASRWRPACRSRPPGPRSAARPPPGRGAGRAAAARSPAAPSARAAAASRLAGLPDEVAAAVRRCSGRPGGRSRSRRPTRRGCASSALTRAIAAAAARRAAAAGQRADRAGTRCRRRRRPRMLAGAAAAVHRRAGHGRRCGTTRRVAIPLLEYLDRAGVTERLPDDRRRLQRPLAGGLAGRPPREPVRAPGPARPAACRWPIQRASDCAVTGRVQDAGAEVPGGQPGVVRPGTRSMTGRRSGCRGRKQHHW